MDGVKKVLREIYQGMIRDKIEDLQRDNPYIPMLPDDEAEKANKKLVLLVVQQ